MTELIRCDWPGSNELMIKYHDEEWGVPNHDDRKWFEYITLDAFQAENGAGECGLAAAALANKAEAFALLQREADTAHRTEFWGGAKEGFAREGVVSNEVFDL